MYCPYGEYFDVQGLIILTCIDYRVNLMYRRKKLYFYDIYVS